jgi:hypothetical protein
MPAKRLDVKLASFCFVSYQLGVGDIYVVLSGDSLGFYLTHN